MRRAQPRPALPLLAVVALLSSLLAAVATPSPASAAPLPTCGDGSTPGLVALSNPRYYVDTSLTPALTSSYEGWSVRAGETAREGLWLQASGFAGGVVGLAPGQPDAQPVPSLAGGGRSAQYLLLQAGGLTEAPQSHVVTLWQGRPGSGTPLCTRTWAYTGVHDTIKALANKVTGISATGPTASASLGDAVTVTVTGSTGTIGAGPAQDPGVLSYTPTALAGFPAGAWRLERTELTIPPVGGGAPMTLVDRLYLTGASGAARDYTARYVFRAVGPAVSPTAVRPIQYIASGTQVKHTDVGGTSLYALPAVSPVADVTLAKQLLAPAGGLLPSDGGTASYAVVVRSDGAAATVDAVLDVLPSGASYVPGTLRLDGRAGAEPSTSGTSLVVEGPLRVPAGGSTRLTYDVVLDATPGVRTNSVTATYGTVVLDASADVRTSDPATAGVRVLGPGRPALEDDTAATPGPGLPVTVNVLANDTTSSGRSLRITGASAPAHGTVEVGAGGTLTYVPAAGWSGRDAVTYTATDDLTGTGSAVLHVDALPGAVADSAATATGTAVSGQVRTNDTCGTCAVSLASGPTSGALVLGADGAWTLTPTGVAAGASVAFTYRLTDTATGRTSDAVVTVDVGDLGADRVATAYGTAVAVDVISNDSGCKNNCRPVTGTAPARGTVVYPTANATDKRVVYTPTAGLWGLDAFTYGTTGPSAAGAVTVLVGPPATTLRTTYGVATSLALPAGGLCSGCSYALLDPPAHGAAGVHPTTGLLTYDPGTAAGTGALTWVVRHPQSGLQATGAVTLVVGPAAVDDTATGLVHAPLVVDTAANDTCPATCTRTLLSGPTGAALSTAGTLTWTPSAIGTRTATYRVSSSASGSDATSTATVSLTVEGAADDDATTVAGTPVVVDVRANDPCALCSGPEPVGAGAGTVVPDASGGLRYAPPTGWSGTDRVTYLLRSGSETTRAQVVVHVLPRGEDDQAVTLQDRAVQLRVLDDDACSGCRVTGISAEVGGTATVLPGDQVVRFVPAPGSTGTAGFDYALQDASGGTSTAHVTVQVIAPPTPSDDAATTPADVAVDVDVLADDDCLGCSVDVVTDPDRGTVSLSASGGLRYAPAPGTSGRASFTYAVTDPATGAWGTAQVVVTVLPVAQDDTAWTPVGVPVEVDVLADDSCTGCSLQVLSGEGASAVGDRVRVEPAPGVSGAVTVPYRATDPVTGHSTDAALRVDVSDARPDAAATAHGVPVVVDVLANDLCDGCAITSVSAPGMTDGAQVTVPGDVPGLHVLTYAAGTDGHEVSSAVRVLVGDPATSVPVLRDTPVTADAMEGVTCDGCVVSLRTPPAVGEVELAPDGALTYWPAPRWTGDDPLVLRVTDPVSGLHVDLVRTLVVSAPVAAPALALSSSAGEAAAGTVPLSHVVTNTGDVTLTGLVVTVDRGSAVSCPSDEVAVGTALTCTSTLVLDQADVDAGSASVGTSATAGSAHGSDVVSVTVARTSSLSVTGSGDLVGDDLVLTWTVTDTGTTTLTGVAVDGAACAPTTLLPSGTATCTTTVPVTPTDIAAGEVRRPGVAAAGSPTGPITASAPLVVALPGAPAGEEPVPTTAVPVATTAAPVPTTQAPVPTTAPPVPTTQAPVPTTQVPVPPTAAPEPSTPAPTAPAPTAPAPAPSPAAPAPGAPAPAPTTPEPAPTTPAPVTPAPTSAEPTGTVTGTAWFDRDGDGGRDPGEWPLPGVTVELHRAGGAFALAASAALGAPRTVTGRDGGFRFTGLAPGAYVVTAADDLRGIDPTSDSDGPADWVVRVEVGEGRARVADFAALGLGELRGQVFEQGSAAAVPGALVRCTWAGFDDVPGTSDDVVIEQAAGPDGRFALAGVPYGAFSCRGVDPATGRGSARAAVSVLGPDPVEAPLPLTSEAQPVTARLPMTGSGSGGLLGWALGALVAGALVQRAARRTRPSLGA